MLLNFFEMSISDICMIINTITKYRLILFSNLSLAVTPRTIHTIAPIGIRVANEYLNPSLRHTFDIAHCIIISITMIIEVATQLNKGYAGKHKRAITFRAISMPPMNIEIFCIAFKD